jgi:hypothetical protein
VWQINQIIEYQFNHFLFILLALFGPTLHIIFALCACNLYAGVAYIYTAGTTTAAAAA